MPEVSSPQNQPAPAPQGQPSPFKGEGGSKMGIIIGLIVLVVVIGGGYYFMQQKKDGGDVVLTTPTTPTTTTPTTPTTTTPTTTVQPTAPSATAGFMTYSDSLYGFKVDYPKEWSMDAESGLVAVIFSSQFESDLDMFSENVNITTEDVSYYAPITLEEYGDAAYDQLLLALPEYILIERDYRNLGDLDAAYLLGSYTIEGIELEVLSLYAMEDNIVYVLTYTAEVGQKSKYDAQVEQMIDSFQLL